MGTPRKFLFSFKKIDKNVRNNVDKVDSLYLNLKYFFNEILSFFKSTNIYCRKS